METEKNGFVKYHLPCPLCSSSDAVSVNKDGSAYCFSCQEYIKEYNMETTEIQSTNSKNEYEVSDYLKQSNYAEIIDRNIREQTCKRYGVSVVKEGNMITDHMYKYYDKDSNHIGTKFRRTSDKQFWSEGNLSEAGLFGQNIFGQAGKFITICEGELDAMSAYQLLGSKWPVVSIKNGAQSALKNCRQALDYLNKFDTVVLCFDNDQQGRDAQQAVAKLFEPNKCKIMNLEFKDANEYLKIGQREKFVQTWWNAQTYTPAGIINLADLGRSLYEETHNQTCPYPWSKLNEKTYGMRTGELLTFTSGAGMGKSSIMRELMYHLMHNTEENIGVLAMEENTKQTAFNLMSVEANARLYIKEIRDQYTQEQLDDWQEKTLGSGRFYVFDHFGSMDNDEILNRVRYMAKALNTKWIILDHLSILVSGQEDNGDERKSIDILMTKLRSLVEETQIGLLLVSHLRRPAGDRGHEDGREITLSHLRGSASIAHLSDAVLALERNQQAEDEVEANTTTVRILKNRYTGETGIACYLHYDSNTGRMTQVANPFMEDDDE